MKHNVTINSTRQNLNKRSQSIDFFYEDTAVYNLDETIPKHMLFKRALKTLVLFEGCPSSNLIDILRSSKYLIGILLSSNEFKSCSSISKYNYVYIGTEGDKKLSFSYGIKELSFKGWNIIDPKNLVLPNLENKYHTALLEKVISTSLSKT